MIFITAKFLVRPEDADRWPEISRDFTQATRSEPGCKWFEWSRSLDNPAEYVLVEAFRDQDAGVAHVTSAHFKEAQKTLPPHLAATPKIVNVTVEQDDWSELGEMAVPAATRPCRTSRARFPGRPGLRAGGPPRTGARWRRWPRSVSWPNPRSVSAPPGRRLPARPR